MDKQTEAMDGGAKSRKLWYGAVTSFLIMYGAMLASHSEAFAAVYDTLTGGLLGAYGLYCTGNLGAKWVNGKKAPAATETE